MNGCESLAIEKVWTFFDLTRRNRLGSSAIHSPSLNLDFFIIS